MFRIANAISGEIAPESLIILIAKSLIDETNARKDPSPASGTISSIKLTLAFMYGLVVSNSPKRKRNFPSRITVVELSGISSIRTTLATVPNGNN